MTCDTNNTWELEVIPMIRALISDNISPYTYSDQRIREFAVVGASMVINEITFDNTYVADVSDSTITPDPKPLADKAFMMFISMKAACMVINNEARLATKNAVKWTDGPSSLSTEAGAKELSALANRMCDDYEKAKMNWALGPGGIGGEAVLSPYTNSNVGDYYHPFRVDFF